MIKVSGTATDLKVKIFSGEADKVEKDLSSFLADKKIRLQGSAQSQSTIANSFAVNITATVLYSEFEGSRDEKIGFNR